MENIPKEIGRSILVPCVKWIIGGIRHLSVYYVVEYLNKRKWRHFEKIPFWFPEVYVLGWSVLIFAALALIPQSSNLLVVLVALSTYRLLDIALALCKIIFIEREKREDEYGHYVVARNVSRWVILTFINIFEIIQCFAVLYLFWGHGFSKEITDPLSAFYHSIMTMTTLGYGHYCAESGMAKILVICQLIYFLMFILLVVPTVFSTVRAKELTNEILGETDKHNE